MNEEQSFFGEFTNIFKRFNKNNITRITEINIYLIQFKLSAVLYNLKMFAKVFKIDTDNNYLYKNG